MILHGLCKQITLEKIDALKNRLDACRPFPQSVLDSLENWFEVELTYASNAIEGNTLTRLETALVLNKGLTVGGKSMKDHLEATNHKAALQFMKNLVEHTSVSWDDLLALHHLILKGIDDSQAGTIRTMPVRIAGALVVLPNPLKVPALCDQFAQWMQSQQEHPAYFAALAHYKLVTIHPFIDGNGRTARLLMNLILMQHGYPPAIITPKDRLKYIKSLEKAQLGGALDDYLYIIYQAVSRSLQIYLKALNQERPTHAEGSDTLLKIGALAQSTQESVATIRYWTKIGLLDVETTTPSGYQLYKSSMIERCQYVRALQKHRYTLEEISAKIHNEVSLSL